MAGLLWPIEGHHTTQQFAGEHPFEPELFLATDGAGPRRARAKPFPKGVRFAHLHGAIDIGCPIGTKVFAPEAGKIVAASSYKSTGENFMMLEIKPGTILFFTHLDEFKAKVGHRVQRGQVIARSGNSGMSTGPHLHWEVRITTNTEADFRRSGHWFKWNPRRLRVGGDLAGLLAIVAPGSEPDEPPDPSDQDADPPEIAAGPIDEAPLPAGEPDDPLSGPPETALDAPGDPVAVETDPDPDEPPLEEGDEDTFGDAAATLDRVPNGPSGVFGPGHGA